MTSSNSTRQFTSGVAESAYRHVIENAISGLENLPYGDAIDYLRTEWLPFARGCVEAWQASDAGVESVGTESARATPQTPPGRPTTERGR